MTIFIMIKLILFLLTALFILVVIRVNQSKFYKKRKMNSWEEGIWMQVNNCIWIFSLGLVFLLFFYLKDVFKF